MEGLALWIFITGCLLLLARFLFNAVLLDDLRHLEETGQLKARSAEPQMVERSSFLESVLTPPWISPEARHLPMYRGVRLCGWAGAALCLGAAGLSILPT
jgi:hypothetical protein